MTLDALRPRATTRDKLLTGVFAVEAIGVGNATVMGAGLALSGAYVASLGNTVITWSNFTSDRIIYAGPVNVELSRHSHDAVGAATQAMQALSKFRTT